ncbi:MAG: hypothetical protein JSR82_13525 [Verrucomicrobia bacterium]|nr:hypothetical protein [Verrucomicrobiota bacterium]
MPTVPAQVAPTTLQFNVPADRKVSLGVYDPEGRLVRTLLRVEPLTGSQSLTWDNTDDNGSPVPTHAGGVPVDYTFRLLQHNIVWEWQGVVGNTSTSKTGQQIHTGQYPLLALAAVPSPEASPGDARVRLFMSCGFNEGGPIMRRADWSPADPSQIGKCDYISSDNNGLPYLRPPDRTIAPLHICADADKAYWANSQSYDIRARFVFATNVRDSGTNLRDRLFHFPLGYRIYLEGGSGNCGRTGEEVYPASTPQGCDFDYPNHWPSVLDVRQRDVREDGTWMLETTGIAVQQTGTQLVVLHGREIRYEPVRNKNNVITGYLPAEENEQDIVTLFDKLTGQPRDLGDIHLSTWGLTAPKAVAIHDSTVYIVCKRIDNGQWIVFPFSIVPDGLTPTIVPKSGHIGGNWWNRTFAEPLAIGVSPNGQRVLVVVGGAEQQVLSFDPLGNQNWAFGQPGGYANGPEVTFDKFDFGRSGLRGGIVGAAITFAPDGTFWLAEPGTSRTRRFQINSSAPWLTQLDQIMYLPRVYDCGVVRGEPTRLLSGPLEFEVNYALDVKAPGAWTLKRNFSHYRETATAVIQPYPNEYRYSEKDVFSQVATVRKPAAYVPGQPLPPDLKRSFFFCYRYVASDYLGNPPRLQTGQREYALLELKARPDGTGHIERTGYTFLMEAYDAPPVLDEYGEIRFAKLVPGKREFFSSRLRYDSQESPVEVGDFVPQGNDIVFVAGARTKRAETPVGTSVILPEVSTLSVPVAPLSRMPIAGNMALQLSNARIPSVPGQQQNHLGAVRFLPVDPGNPTYTSGWSWKSMPDGPMRDLKCYYQIVAGANIQEDNMSRAVDALGSDIIVDYSGLYFPQSVPGTQGGKPANQYLHYDASGLPIAQFGKFLEDTAVTYPPTVVEGPP